MLFETFPQGYGGRWTFGTVILVYVIAYNEACAPTVLFSSLIAALYSLFSATCKSAVKHLQIPYIRASNKFDFICLFLGMWMDILTILISCAALSRTLSTCLDAMTGGLARILILGRNSPSNEPWPDVLGVCVVFLVTGMFMLGLENTKVFSIVMMIGMFGVNLILTIVSWLYGDYDEWNKNLLRPDGVNSLFTSAALLTFSYPSEMPNKQGWKRLIGCILILMVCLSTILSSACLSMIVHPKFNNDYVASPFFTVLDEINSHKLVPAAACLLLLACSGAFLELFPEMYSIIVRLATSEWKILTKHISYESPDSGNPILAIFIAGSLLSMLAFACPLQILTHMMAASHICSGLFRAFYLLYTPFKPKFTQQSNISSSQSYSRLSTAPPPEPSTSTGTGSTNTGARRKTAWNFNLPKSRSRTLRKKKEMEKEWLLLGEPSSPRPVQPTDENNAESTVFSDLEVPLSDNEFTTQLQNSDSDTSTDIDAIVDEYRQKIKVTTAGPMDKTIRVPSNASWRVTIFAIFVILFGIGLIISGINFHIVSACVTGIIGVLIISIIMHFIPKYTSGNLGTNLPPIICIFTITLGSLLLSFCFVLSWPAILFWLIGGLLLALRCDKWCCTCLEPSSDTENIIPSISGKTTSIRIPRPPKGFILSGHRIQRYRHNSR